MIDYEPDRERQQIKADARAREQAYRSIWQRLQDIRAAERYRDKCAFKRTGITHPARLHGRKPEEIDPAFCRAMQRLWDVGTLSQGRADTELRRPYHLIAQGRAPLTEADVITLVDMPEGRLRLLLPWLAHQFSLAEANRCVARGEPAPPVITEEGT